MRFIYNLSINLYSLLIAVASLFNKKAKLRYIGVKNTRKNIQNYTSKQKTLWVHCASLGEFEQGRPFIERFKEKYPDYKVVLTFFSPSGYEIRKNTELADNVLYLPSDTRKNASKFICRINPSVVIFVKYEFWYHYLKTLHKNNIPTYLISGIFRKNQIFFKSHGAFFRKILKYFTHLFVQNEQSANLLHSVSITNYTIAGDTRFDRVAEIAKNKKQIPFIEKFKQNNLIFIAGSSWQPDEDLIIKFINETSYKIKFIIAPHEIHKSNIERITKEIDKKVAKFSEKEAANSQNANVLIIDNIGLLSSLYGYADIAYIGGGFKTGLHNTLEAAVFGLPVIFGNKYQKFDEAKELIEKKAAFSINNYSEFSKILNKLIENNDFRKETGKKAGDFVKTHTGSTDKILQMI